MDISMRKTWAPEGRRGAASRAWGWMRRHWLDVLLPPATFLLGAGITRHVLWVQGEQRYAGSRQHFQSAVQAKQKGDQARALRDLEAAARDAPDTADVHLQLAQGFQQLQQPLSAFQQQEQGLHLSPPKEPDYAQLIAGYCSLQRFDDAERVLRRDMLPRWPNSANAAYFRGILALRHGSGDAPFRQAIVHFSRCLQLSPKHAGARYQHGICLTHLGNPAEAERDLRDVLRAAPQYPGALQALSGALLQEGKRKEADQILASMRRMDDVRQSIKYIESRRHLGRVPATDLLELGSLYLETGTLPNAEAALQEYAILKPTDPRCRRKLAEVHRKMNRKLQAASDLQLAAALESNRRSQ